MTITLRPLDAADGRALHALIEACPPLDVNSVYLYHLLAHHFGATSVAAMADDQMVGAVTGYRLPDDPATIFIWQVAVASAGRGQGLAPRMLADIVDRHPDLRRMQTTIGPDNQASQRVFAKFAAARGGTMQQTPFLSATDCSPLHGHEGASHDPEDLFTIDFGA